MNTIEPIASIMSTNIITLNKTDELETAEHLFKKHKIRHIPVVEADRIMGILSYTDLLRISFADAIDESETEIETLVYNMFTIEQVMANNVTTVTSNTSIKEVAKILSEKEFHAIPVVDEDHLVGIVTTTDLINYMLTQF
ncbi:CBS domain-containing protein [Winogradskyella sediminis]|uniref:CBS domain-containing protein n=1 Tax=Winogradskyella sediminis TaxID=1382466 RepID=A0A1H1PSC0_9FLAO|nr:CBS domain-containing protein [Winogradskyella sediminis]SDS14241.1 CBS domain-containing protein [Winogradskyella sediminis]